MHTLPLFPQSLTALGITSIGAQQLFMEHSEVREYHKNDPVFMERKPNAREYLLLQGVLHRFNMNPDGEQITTGFYMAVDVVTPHFARTVNNRSIFSLQALTDNTLIAEIPVEALDYLRSSNMEFRDFGQRVLESELSAQLLNDVAFRSFPARDRLLILRDTFPNIENLVPHYIIASYLGITQVSFSRLRKELAGK